MKTAKQGRKLTLHYPLSGLFGIDEIQLTPRSLLVDFGIWGSPQEHQAKQKPLNNYRLQLQLTEGEFQRDYPLLYEKITKIALDISDANLPGWSFLLLRLNFTERRGEVFAAVSAESPSNLQDARLQPITEKIFDQLITGQEPLLAEFIEIIFNLAEKQHVDPVRLNPAGSAQVVGV
jgi:hypothetical protein